MGPCYLGGLLPFSINMLLVSAWCTWCTFTWCMYLVSYYFRSNSPKNLEIYYGCPLPIRVCLRGGIFSHETHFYRLLILSCYVLNALSLLVVTWLVYFQLYIFQKTEAPTGAWSTRDESSLVLHAPVGASVFSSRKLSSRFELYCIPASMYTLWL